MKYDITLNDEDYLKFNIFYARHSNEGKRSLRVMQLFMPAISILLVLAFILSGSRAGFILTEAICLTALSVFWTLYAPKRLEKNVHKNIERLRKNGKLPYHACAEIEFLDSMIIERYEQGEFRLNYTDIENLCFENDSIYIFYTALQAFIIPYRCLGADRDRVTGFLLEKNKNV